MANKDVTKLVKNLKKAGWTVEQSKKNYYYAYPPDDVDKTKPVRIPSTPSSHRWYRNTLAQLKRRGYGGT